MVDFDCPYCGTQMEVKSKMIGEDVDCISCNQLVTVPEKTIKTNNRKKRKKKDPGLTNSEWNFFILLFLFIPFVIVFLSSILYYIWKSDQPTKADQVNKLGFIMFGVHVALFVLFIIIIAVLD